LGAIIPFSGDGLSRFIPNILDSLIRMTKLSRQKKQEQEKREEEDEKAKMKVEEFNANLSLALNTASVLLGAVEGQFSPLYWFNTTFTFP